MECFFSTKPTIPTERKLEVYIRSKKMSVREHVSTLASDRATQLVSRQCRRVRITSSAGASTATTGRADVTHHGPLISILQLAATYGSHNALIDARHFIDCRNLYYRNIECHLFKPARLMPAVYKIFIEDSNSSCTDQVRMLHSIICRRWKRRYEFN